MITAADFDLRPRVVTPVELMALKAYSENISVLQLRSEKHTYLVKTTFWREDGNMSIISRTS
jgi:hypothetical protein